jgi:hypothetical protein
LEQHSSLTTGTRCDGRVLSFQHSTTKAQRAVTQATAGQVTTQQGTQDGRGAMEEIE